MKTTKRTATEAYNEHTERARQNLKRIMEGLGSHIARTGTTPAGTHKTTVDWGDVGDVAHLCDLLETAARFINDEED
ncbi:hypothetical protein H8E07_20130 [bacterium]|nr:hypothetical protein [bacterium]